MSGISEVLERARQWILAGGRERREPRPRVGVALGGGFARGIAHIGVLRVFEEHGIPIDVLAGTSVGALVGAGYASGGSLDEMEREAIHTKFRDFGRWTLSRLGMATNERLEHYLGRFTTCRTFEELKIPLAIVATDIIAGKSIAFRHGEIGPALRASCAYPGLFLPVEHEGHYLVDGFLTATVPAAAAREMGAELVIGVLLEPGLLSEKPRNTIEVISRSFSILQTATMQKWRSACDLVIAPEVHHILWDDFGRTPELVEAGVQAALEALPRIRVLMSAPLRGIRSGQAAAASRQKQIKGE